jgi:hypothetical protein
VAYVRLYFYENMSNADKAAALNRLETQYDEAVSYIDALSHDATYYTKNLADSTFYRTASHPSGRSDTGHGCHIDAASVDGYSLDQLLAKAVSPGIIAWWGGSAGSLSSAWQICDGTDGYPDFRGKILLGAGGGISPGAVGGALTVTPSANAFNPDTWALTTNQIPKHTHNYVDVYNNRGVYGAGLQYYTDPSDHNQTTTGINGVPNASPTAHDHNGASFLWSGWYDAGSVWHSGALSILPPVRAVYYVVKK